MPAVLRCAARYGLYYGVLSRDCAEVASDRIASMMGTGRKMAVSVRDCGICGGELAVSGRAGIGFLESFLCVCGWGCACVWLGGNGGERVGWIFW